jgi:hypothetical protein
MKATIENSDLLISKICWTSVAMLLGFLCLTHLGVQLSFLMNGSLPAMLAPFVFLVTILIGDQLGHRVGLDGKQRLLPIVITFCIAIVSIFFSALIYDLSWDGQWYHQTAIYKIAAGWNPLADPMHNFDEHNDLWIRHYTKGTWFASAALFKTFGYIEWSKAITWMTFFACFMAVFATALDFQINRFISVAIAAAITINPVTTCSLYSFQVDGILVSLLACYLGAMFSLLKKYNILTLYVCICAMMFAINTKFTGLVFICFFAAGTAIYLLIWQREIIFRFILVHFAAVVVAVVIMGFNPYVTNTIHRGHPFFPILGTKEYPGFEAEGADDIEKWETPDNLKGQSRLKRLTYGIFGRPGAQPWIKGKNAELMIPFFATPEDIALYRFMDVRIAGLGPYFSGIMILSLILSIVILFKNDVPKVMLIISSLTIIATLLISNHTWWARYAPQLWWLPIIPIVIIFYKAQYKQLVKFAWIILILIFINAMLITVVHLRWEINSTQTLHHQLEAIKKSNTLIEVDFQWFGTPVGERFKTWNIPYKAVKQDQLPDGIKFMSVVEGYPGCVLYKPIDIAN